MQITRVNWSLLIWLFATSPMEAKSHRSKITEEFFHHHHHQPPQKKTPEIHVNSESFVGGGS